MIPKLPIQPIQPLQTKRPTLILPELAKSVPVDNGSGPMPRLREFDPSALQGLGGILSAMASSPNSQPSPGLGAFGGALQGIGAGPFGILAGALSGYIGAAQARTDFDTQQEAPEFEDGGPVDSTDGKSVPIQTELGEFILKPDLSIIKSNANKRHNQMEDDFITDIVPEGSFVFSNDKSQTIKASDDAIMHILSESDNKPPKPISLSDLIGKKRITYAEAADKIDRKYKVVENEDYDIFTEATNTENKMARLPILQHLVMRQESGKDGVQTFKYGGQVKKYQGIVGSSFVDSPMDLFPQLYNELDTLQEENVMDAGISRYDFDQLMERQGQRNTVGLIGSTLLTGLQSTQVDPVINSNAYINEAFEQIPESVIQNQISQIRRGLNTSLRGLTNQGVRPTSAAAISGAAQSRLIEAESGLRSQYALDSIATRRGEAAARRELMINNNTNRVNARNQQRSAQNKRLSVMAGGVRDFLNTAGRIDANRFQGRQALQNSYNTNRFNILQSKLGLAGVDLNYALQNRRLDGMDEDLRRSLFEQQRRGDRVVPQLPTRTSQIPLTLPELQTQGNSIGQRIRSSLPSLFPDFISQYLPG